MQGYDTLKSHTAQLMHQACKILKLIHKKVQPELWSSFFRTANRSDTETIAKKEQIITLVEYYYGKSKFHLAAPLHPNFCIHPVYQYVQAIDLKTEIEPLLNMSINELKAEMSKTPKFLRTIRSNKAPILLDAKYGMKVDPYKSMDPNLIKHRAKLIRENETFSKNILTALRKLLKKKIKQRPRNFIRRKCCIKSLPQIKIHHFFLPGMPHHLKKKEIIG